MSWGASWKPLLLRWAILLVVLIVAVLCMSGCGQKSEEPAKPSPQEEEHKHPDDSPTTKPLETPSEDHRCVGVTYKTHTVVINKATQDPELRKKIFSPSVLEIVACDKVQWINKDSIMQYHTATGGNPDMDKIDDPNFKPMFDTGGITKGTASKLVQFADSGEFPYFCKPHHWMRGKIKVVSRRK